MTRIACYLHRGCGISARENLMAVLHHEKPEYIPFFIYSGLIGIGSFERELRNMGLGIIHAWTPVYKAEHPNVRVEERETGGIIHREFHTPVGTVSMKIRTGLKRGTGGKWIVEHMIKDVSDYKVIKFIIDDTVYRPDYDFFLELERDIGGDGVVAAGVDPTPLTKLWVDYMGLERLSIALYKHPRELDDLIQTISRKQEEAYRIVAESPAELVWCGEQVNGAIINPRLFRKYYLPEFEKYAEILHAKRKIFSVHMDGLLKNLKDEVKDTSIDIVEAFTPPPMGDLTLREAREAWRDKFIIWVNFPETLFHHGSQEVERHMIRLLREAAPGDRVVMGITEDMPLNMMQEGLRSIIRTIRRHGKYPIKFHS
ncbi:MAG: uroporphyrinogen decarboxylase family protein [Thermoproteota archaeon]